jgi:hypothetical protein
VDVDEPEPVDEPAGPGDDPKVDEPETEDRPVDELKLKDQPE